MREVTPDLVESWELGRSLPTRMGMTPRGFIVVGKEEGEVELAERDGDDYVVRAYSPGNIMLSDEGAHVCQVVATRSVARITKDEYYGRQEPSKLNKAYINIIRGL